MFKHTLFLAALTLLCALNYSVESATTQTNNRVNQSGGGGGGTPGGASGTVQVNSAGSFAGVPYWQLGSNLVTSAPTTLGRWRAAIANMNDGSGFYQGKILVIGDSLTVGALASAQTNVTAAMAKQITSRFGFGSTNTGFIGGGVASSRRVSFDNRIGLNAGWGYSTDRTLGGNMFCNSTTTNALSFTPGFVGDKLIVITKTTSGGGSYTADYDGVAVSGAQSTSGADGISSYTYTGSGTTYNIKRTTGGEVCVIGMIHYNSQNNVVVLINAGESGATTADLVASGTWSPMNVANHINADLNIITLGTNDWSFGVGGTAAYSANLQTMFNAISPNNDVMFQTPMPANPADGFGYNVSTTTQKTYTAAMKTVAAANNTLVADVFDRWVDYTTANAWGFYAADNFHGNAKGYGDVGNVLASTAFGQGAGGQINSLSHSYDTLLGGGYKITGVTTLALRLGNSIYSNGSDGASSTGPFNSAYGLNAANSLSSGFNNVAIGYNALTAATAAQANTAIGSGAGDTVTGSNNTIIGFQVGGTTLTTGGSNILIGTSAGVDTPAAGTTSYLNIGNGLRGYTTAPTIASGFGTSPTIAAGTSTFTFNINVGTGGTANNGVLTMPAAPNGWNLFCTDITTPAVNRTVMTAQTTTSATLTNYNTTTGVAAAWAASDVLNCMAMAY